MVGQHPHENRSCAGDRPFKRPCAHIVMCYVPRCKLPTLGSQPFEQEEEVFETIQREHEFESSHVRRLTVAAKIQAQRQISKNTRGCAQVHSAHRASNPTIVFVEALLRKFPRSMHHR